MTPESLARTLEHFLSGCQGAVVVENGAVLFDLTASKYSISGERNKCLLHVWSTERNVVRRVLEAQIKNEVLQLAVQKLGQSRPTKLTICRERDRRTVSAKRASRIAYQRILQRVVERHFPGFTAGPLTTSADLSHSFGPVYSRGLLQRGRSAFAVLGVNDQETQASIDAALTFGILWMDQCRHANAGHLAVEGLKVFVPAGASILISERMANLNSEVAKWHLYELDQNDDSLTQKDYSDRGNARTRLVHCTDEAAIQRQFAESIARVREIMPEAEIAILSPAEIAFRCHGLEFCRARLGQDQSLFRNTIETVFGLGAGEQILTEDNVGQFRQLIRTIR
ncbi:MAG: hypothetical protein JOY93_05150 [Acidobacteriales bacterium]|nr:hypothetical protein [Terriglobales bacterium]